MSLDNVQFKVSYDGDGSQKDFDFPNVRILAEGDLTVIIRDALNNETVLTLDVDYTVSGVNEAAGGTVTCAVAPGATDEIHIIRLMDLKQFLELQADGAIPSSALEQTLDRIVMMMQQVSGKTDRAVMLTLTTALDEIYLPDPETNAGKYLKFKADGTGMEAAEFQSAGSVQVSALGQTLIIKATAGEMRSVLGLGTAATRDTGTAAANVPLISDLGGAALKDTGTAAGEVPTNADLGTAAYETAGTFGKTLMGEASAASARASLSLGSAATADVGTGANDVPSVSLLGEFAFLALAEAPGGFPYLAGLDLAVNETDAEHDIDILKGVTQEEGGALTLKLTTTLTKQIDAAWAQGTGAGGMFAGTVAADTWYHVHLIRNDSTTDIDAGFDTDLAAVNKPAGWSSYRYLGSVLTDSSANILDFVSAGGGGGGSWPGSSFGATLVKATTSTAARSVLELGTAALLDAGTGAGEAVQLDGSSKLPAVDGSQLTGLTSWPGSDFGATLVKATTSTAARSVLELGTAALLDAGTGANDVPSMTLMGEFAFIDRAEAPAGFPFIVGLELGVNETDPDHDIDILKGVAREEGGIDTLKLTGTFRKRIDAVWAAGSGSGGMFTGTVEANTWYHVHLIRHDASGDIDAGFDISLTAANKPSGWGSYRWIGSVLTDANANILDFTSANDVLPGLGAKGYLIAGTGSGYAALPAPATDNLSLVSDATQAEGLAWKEFFASGTIPITTFGRSLIDDVDAAAGRTTLGLGSAATANVGTGANDLPSVTMLGTAAFEDAGTFGKTLMGEATATAARSDLGLGSAATANVGTGANDLPSVALLGTAAFEDAGTFGITLMGEATAASARADLGLGSAATANVGTGANDVPSVTLLGTAAFKDTGTADAEVPLNSNTQGWELFFVMPGSMAAATFVLPPFPMAMSLTITKAWANAKAAPTGATLIFDINIGGTSIWDSTPANRIQIDPGATAGTQSSFDTTAIAPGDLLTIDVDQIGATVEGADVTVALSGTKKLNA